MTFVLRKKRINDLVVCKFYDLSDTNLVKIINSSINNVSSHDFFLFFYEAGFRGNC